MEAITAPKARERTDSATRNLIKRYRDWLQITATLHWYNDVPESILTSKTRS